MHFVFVSEYIIDCASLYQYNKLADNILNTCDVHITDTYAGSSMVCVTFRHVDATVTLIGTFVCPLDFCCRFKHFVSFIAGMVLPAFLPDICRQKLSREG